MGPSAVVGERLPFALIPAPRRPARVEPGGLTRLLAVDGVGVVSMRVLLGPRRPGLRGGLCATTGAKPPSSAGWAFLDLGGLGVSLPSTSWYTPPPTTHVRTTYAAARRLTPCRSSLVLLPVNRRQASRSIAQGGGWSHASAVADDASGRQDARAATCSADRSVSGGLSQARRPTGVDRAAELNAASPSKQRYARSLYEVALVVVSDFDDENSCNFRPDAGPCSAWKRSAGRWSARRSLHGDSRSGRVPRLV